MKSGTLEYYNLHRWVRRHKGSAKTCSNCGSTKNVQWANISGEYREDLNDYKELCATCHGIFDRGKHRRWQWSEEAKARQSERMRGNVPWNKGKTWPPEIRAKMSGPRPSVAGKNNPNYKHGERVGLT